MQTVSSTNIRFELRAPRTWRSYETPTSLRLGNSLLITCRLWFFWQAKNALANDVSLNLAGATPKGFGAGEKE
jgi:hypothetical protein